MKNLKKLSRQAAKQINGGALARCSNTNPCIRGYCCDGICTQVRCPIN